VIAYKYNEFPYDAIKDSIGHDSMQDEITVLGSIIVPSKGWKSSNIWEQL
jgi:hypothetical protein